VRREGGGRREIEVRSQGGGRGQERTGFLVLCKVERVRMECQLQTEREKERER
jgi:hypothetical protein